MIFICIIGETQEQNCQLHTFEVIVQSVQVFDIKTDFHVALFSRIYINMEKQIIPLSQHSDFSLLIHLSILMPPNCQNECSKVSSTERRGRKLGTGIYQALYRLMVLRHYCFINSFLTTLTYILSFRKEREWRNVVIDGNGVINQHTLDKERQDRFIFYFKIQNWHEQSHAR